MKPLSAEYKFLLPLPSIVEICNRCQRGLVVYLGMGDGDPRIPSVLRPKPWCYTCSNDEPGIPFTRVDDL